jgi:hypothetical protein
MRTLHLPALLPEARPNCQEEIKHGCRLSSDRELQAANFESLVRKSAPIKTRLRRRLVHFRRLLADGRPVCGI